MTLRRLFTTAPSTPKKQTPSTIVTSTHNRCSLLQGLHLLFTTNVFAIHPSYFIHQPWTRRYWYICRKTSLLGPTQSPPASKLHVSTLDRTFVLDLTIIPPHSYRLITWRNSYFALSRENPLSTSCGPHHRHVTNRQTRESLPIWAPSPPHSLIVRLKVTDIISL